MRLHKMFPFFLLGCASVSVPTDPGHKAANVSSGTTQESDSGWPKLDPIYAEKAVDLSLHCSKVASPHYYEKIHSKIKAKSAHPAFFGCYDWHSSVHGHWAMLRILHQLPNFSKRKQAMQILNQHLTDQNIKKELDFFLKNPGFEFPYGYGWFFRLAHEVRSSSLPEGKKWSLALLPLEKHLETSFIRFLQKQNRPVRIGAHGNSAYSLIHAWDYASFTQNKSFMDVVSTKAREFYGQDKSCPLAYEPSSGDFISPCFVTADLMRRVLTKAEFRKWFDLYLPSLDPKLLEPVVPLDLKDYILGHFIGLMYQKASSMNGVAQSLDGNDPRRAVLLRSAQVQAETAWRLMFDSGYGGTHWLASFAIFYYGSVGKAMGP